MHRIPLLIPEPSINWERNLAEWALFERTLNKANMEETNSFLSILDLEAEFYRSHCYKITEDMFYSAQQFFADNNSISYAEAKRLINYLILRTPKDSRVLASALKIRGSMSYHDCFFEQASKDYEMYLEVYKINKTPNEEICEVYGRLVICMYMMRTFSKVKTYFRLYKRYKAKLLPNILEKPNFVKIENYIKEFINEVNDAENSVPTFLEVQCKIIPYKGFTSCVEIPAASSMCFYHNDGLYVKEDISKGSVLFIEEPILQSINVPLIQCEVCYKMSSQHMYTCLECRYKSYCSLSCLEKDKVAHRDECLGYEQLTILVLDASSIFRIFVRISNKLHKNIFNPQIFRKLRKASEVWDKMQDLLQDNQANDFCDFELIKTQPCYSRLSEIQYSTLVATAFRLTVFIERKTDLIEKFYKKLHISNKQKLILIGSVLMRIHCNILLNSFDFEITKTLKTSKVTNSYYLSIEDIAEMIQNINRRQCLVKDIDKFYDIDVKRDIWQRAEKIIKEKKNIIEMNVPHLIILKHVKSCDRIHRILSTYKDNIAELYFQLELVHSIIYGQAASEPTSSSSSKILCSRIGDMLDIDRCMFVKKFARLFHIHYAEYFLQMFLRDKEIKQVLTLYCPTLRKFKHSCEPNVEIIVLDNGSVIGKSLRKIKKGEQLYVSYKAHYMHHVKIDRQRFLHRFDVKCICRYCKMSELDEPINLRLAIRCESCKYVNITPSQVVCPLCKVQYSHLLNKYQKIIYVLENELKMELSARKSTERDIYILHLILFSYSKMYFTPQNEIRIYIELKLAHFFAVQNFAKQSYNILKEIRNIILKFYEEQVVWFTFYSEMLLIIKIILFNNLEHKLHSLPTSDLYDLCSLGLYIAKGKKYYIEFFEVFDEECSNVLEDIKVLLKWRDQILCSEIQIK